MKIQHLFAGISLLLSTVLVRGQEFSGAASSIAGSGVQPSVAGPASSGPTQGAASSVARSAASSVAQSAASSVRQVSSASEFISEGLTVV
ncbi:hypothetical protein T439DRAFT_49292 [Meredithblackwellia eburnea MCA 4105]